MAGKFCPGCGTIFSKEYIDRIVHDPVEVEVCGGNPEDWYNHCMYCETELVIDSAGLYDIYKSKRDPKCVEIMEEKSEQYVQRKYPSTVNKSSNTRNVYTSGYSCPNCGASAGYKISGSSRIAGALTLGIFSSNMGKTYKCKNCGYKW